MNATEHLLTVLGEEGAEIAQVASKILRFGLHDRNVLNPDGPTNQERLVAELNDLVGVANMLVDIGVLPTDWMCPDKQIAKKRKVSHFMDYAFRVGAIDNLQVRACDVTGQKKKENS
jgi:hypothetical protein